MKKTFIYGCDFCGKRYELKQKSQAGAKAGNWQKVFLCKECKKKTNYK